MQTFSPYGQSVFVKRDDLLHPILNGNKARKFHSLWHISSSQYDTIISYGGAQSNAMLALAWIAKEKGWRFRYYTKVLPETLQKETDGNLKLALELGMQLTEVPHESFLATVHAITPQERSLIVKQGGAESFAEEGITLLAKEINDFCEHYTLYNPAVLLSSGTGTSALYLHRHLHEHIKLYTVPCIGDADYLVQQWMALDARHSPPRILETQHAYSFAKPHPDILTTHQELKNAGIEFDLLYDSVAWTAYKENRHIFENRPLIFIHSGGINGNPTQLERYRYKGLLEENSTP